MDAELLLTKKEMENHRGGGGGRENMLKNVRAKGELPGPSQPGEG